MTTALRPTGTATAAETPRAPWHSLSVADVERELHVSDKGLNWAEARNRLATYGPNDIGAERETPWWSLLLRQFRDPLIYILLVAAVVTFAVGELTDTAVIMAVVIINAMIGFTQEFRARTAMRALARMSTSKAEVVRDSERRTIDSWELVPGDVVLLSSGARIPADLRLAWVHDLELDESTLTGESAAVGKGTTPITDEATVVGDQGNMAFAGTTVTRGRGRGIVVRTGVATELGRIAQSMRDTGKTVTPLQRKIERFGKQIGVLTLFLAIVVAALGVMRGLSVSEIFVVAVAMVIGSVPEGLPVVLTVTLAIGVRRMANRHAIIRSLPAVETLGSTTVIGADKTGTLTKNEMTVRTIWTASGEYDVEGIGYSPRGRILFAGGAALESDALLQQALLIATLANEAEPLVLDGIVERVGDPTDIALHVAAAKGGLNPIETRKLHPQADILPFEPELQLMATVNHHSGMSTLMVKGAPEAVLARCAHMLIGTAGITARVDLDADGLAQKAAALASRGLRVLAVASRDYVGEAVRDQSIRDLTFIGFIALEDPLREESIAAVEAARAAGIRVLMITGDHVNTAESIGRQLGLARDEGVVTGREMAAMSATELDAAVRTHNVFARVAPEQKLRIVESLKRSGEIVAVTGDGVNDAPALRAAHLGIAMGSSGTDVAREASSMILADDNFASITAAMEEGRVVFSNIRKVTFFLLSTAAGEVLTLMFALVAGWPLPFAAAQILWINLVTNGLQDVALAFEPGEPGLLRRRPRSPAEGVLDRRLLGRLGLIGVVLAAGTLGVFWWVLTTTNDLAAARSVAMTQMVVFQFFHVFNCRSLERSVFTIPPLSNKPLFLSLVAAAIAHAAALYLSPFQRIFDTVPPTAEQWLVIVAVGTVVVFGGELDKAFNRMRGHPLY
ncbi:MAG: cation-translocating P-type ATPase [Gemmatimonadaceae bacterium]